MSDIEINEPNMTKSISGYSFSWGEPLHLKVDVSRLTEDAECELSFIHQNGQTTQLLRRLRANLLSTSKITEITRILKRNMDVDWDKILSFISTRSLDDFRKGEQIAWLDDSYGKEPPKFLLPPLFVENAINAIYAERGSAKTTFVLLIDMLLTLPWYDNNLGLPIPPDSRNKVLWCDWENSSQIIGWQKSCILRGMCDAEGQPLGSCDIPYLHMAHPLVTNIVHIQDKILETQANIIIIDSLGMAVGDDLNLTKPAFEFFGALRQLPVTPILIAHTSKDRENRFKTIYGNAYYENEARSIWELSKQQTKGSNELILTLNHRKPAPFQGLHEPLGYKFIFEGDTTRVQQATPSVDNRDTPTLSNNDVVLQILDEANRPLEPKDIKAYTEPSLDGNSIRQALYQLKRSGKVRQEENKYTILR